MTRNERPVYSCHLDLPVAGWELRWRRGGHSGVPGRPQVEASYLVKPVLRSVSLLAGRGWGSWVSFPHWGQWPLCSLSLRRSGRARVVGLGRGLPEDPMRILG